MRPIDRAPQRQVHRRRERDFGREGTPVAATDGWLAGFGIARDTTGNDLRWGTDDAQVAAGDAGAIDDAAIELADVRCDLYLGDGNETR